MVQEGLYAHLAQEHPDYRPPVASQYQQRGPPVPALTGGYGNGFGSVDSLWDTQDDNDGGAQQGYGDGDGQYEDGPPWPQNGQVSLNIALLI